MNDDHSEDHSDDLIEGAAAETPAADIIATAAAAGGFETLLKALEAAGLTETLKGEGPFTVFAPNDEAFAELPDEALAELLEEDNKRDLIELLSRHVMAGNVTSADIEGQTLTPEALSGDILEIDATDGVYVNEATVISADILCSNGVIHVIDAVLMGDDEEDDEDEDEDDDEDGDDDGDDDDHARAGSAEAA
jgi:uncharacterized surface protein with fasciclin (FAS1) repeats